MFTGTAVNIDVQQTITGVNSAQWSAFGLSLTYQVALAHSLGVSVADVDVTAFSARRRLQSSSQSTTVYSTVTARGEAGTQYVYTNIGSPAVQSTVQIALNAVPNLCGGSVKCIVAGTASIVPTPTRAPSSSGGASARSSAGASGSSSGGMSTAMLAGVIGGVVLFVAIVVTLVWRSQLGTKDAARGSFAKGELYSAYGNGHDNFGTVSPAFRRESRGSFSAYPKAQGHSGALELTDYRNSGYGDNSSVVSGDSSYNPGFGNMRKSFNSGNRLTSPAALEDRRMPASGRIEPPAGAPRSVVPRVSGSGSNPVRLSFSRG